VEVNNFDLNLVVFFAFSPFLPPLPLAVFCSFITPSLSLPHHTMFFFCSCMDSLKPQKEKRKEEMTEEDLGRIK
jgi:hypothetical protein